jgi:MFS family permease
MLARAAAGVGTATIVPVANSILGELFDGPRKASALSIFNLGLFLGGVVGFAAGDNLEFRWALVVLAAPAVVVAAVVAWLPVAPRRGGAARATRPGRPSGRRRARCWRVGAFAGSSARRRPWRSPAAHTSPGSRSSWCAARA